MGHSSKSILSCSAIVPVVMHQGGQIFASALTLRVEADDPGNNLIQPLHPGASTKTNENLKFRDAKYAITKVEFAKLKVFIEQHAKACSAMLGHGTIDEKVFAFIGGGFLAGVFGLIFGVMLGNPVVGPVVGIIGFAIAS